MDYVRRIMKQIPVRTLQRNERQAHPSGELRIRTLRDVLAGKPLVEDVHRHAFTFILVVKRGSGVHVIDMVSHPITDHSVFVLRPGQVHQLTIDPSSTGYIVEFTPAYVRAHHHLGKDLFLRVSYTTTSTPRFVEFDRLCHAIRAMLTESEERRRGYEEAIDAHFTTFMIELARQSDASNIDHDDQSAYARDRFDELQELIDQHMTENKRTSAYAGMMNMSVYQLNALTRTMAGCTCAELITSHVVMEAKRQLLATTAQVKEIAYHVGFDDPSYFVRFFKKHVGTSPEAFRSRA